MEEGKGEAKEEEEEEEEEEELRFSVIFGLVIWSKLGKESELREKISLVSFSRSPPLSAKAQMATATSPPAIKMQSDMKPTTALTLIAMRTSFRGEHTYLSY